MFVGCGDGLNDPNWGRLLRRIQRFEARHSHFRLCRAGDIGHAPPVVRNVVYGDDYDDDYDDLIPFLATLAKRGPLRQAPPREPRLLAECGERVAVVAMTPNADTLATAGADRYRFRLWLSRMSGCRPAGLRPFRDGPALCRV